MAVALTLAGCATIERARLAQTDGGDFTQREAPVDASLPGLVDFAFTNRPSVVSAYYAMEDARLALREIAADAPLVSSTPWNAPHLGLTGSYSESSGGTKFSEGHWSTEGDPSAALSLDLLIWDFGRNDARAKAQAERVIAAEAALVGEGYAVFREVANATLTLEERCTLREVAETNVCEFALHLEQTERQHAAGEVKQLDILRAKLDLARAREALVAASNEVVTARAELARALGTGAALGEELRQSNLAHVRRVFPRSELGFDEGYDFARTNAPAMKVALARVRAANRDIDYAIADLLPTLSASASLSWTDPLWYLRWGVNASQSIFTGWRKTTAVDRAVVAHQRALAEVAAVDLDLRRDLRLALADRDNAAEAMATAENTLATAQENLDYVGERYRLGEASRVDFSDALGDYADALGSRATAFYRGQRAEAALFAILGTAPKYLEKNGMTEERP